MSVINKYVFDTNTLLSAIISPDGKSISAQAFHKALKQGVILASDETFAELVDVIFRKRFDKYISDETRFSFLSSFRKAAIWTEVINPVFDCRDPKDNKFLSLAKEANATLIVSGDDDLLILHPYKEIPILNSRQFLDLA
ncbi:MAG: putative toxin-antitoxin system toxin component, PIN family [Spirosomataceae bacterium]